MHILALMMAALFAAGAFLLLRPLFRPAGRSHPAAGRLPPAWRAAWPCLELLAPLAASLLSWRRRKRLATQLLRAGLPGALAPGQVVAAQWLCAAASATATLALLLGLDYGSDRHLLLPIASGAAMTGAAMPCLWLRAEIRRRRGRMARELPFLMDMTTLCVESGLNLQGALKQAAEQGPDGPLRDELLLALADMRAGLPRLQALYAWSDRVDLPGVRALTAALAQADTLGMSLGPVLRAQSERRRAERFQQAEKLAMQAPVKMLFPLVCCIFPCTFVVLAFPIAVQFWQALQ
ncbi:Type II secretion system protein GspF domain-containing protein [Bordetella sputigena]|uniref:type II secretion system F family protein n=1 Tax=Bordetella sputigena TaxID=1416810 RepID=UPI0039EFC8F1